MDRKYAFYRDKINAVNGHVSTWSAAPGGREADLKRLKALATVIFGEAGSEVAGGKRLKYTRRHLEHAMRYREVRRRGGCAAVKRLFKEG